MKNIGFVKLHRKIRDNPIFWKPNYLAVFSFILLDVEFQKCKKALRGDLIELNPWEGLIFQKEIADKFGIALGTVSNIIKRLISETIIETFTNNKYTIVRLVNWEAYQWELETTIENELKTDWNPTETELKHLKNTNKTKNTKKSTRAKKKVEEKPEKIEVEKLVHLLPEELEKVKAIYGNLYKNALLKLSSHKESKGVKYTSDYGTLHRGGWVYDYMVEKYPTLKSVQILAEQTDTNNDHKKKEQEEKDKTETIYKEIRAFYATLSEDEKKKINDRADYELKSFTPQMREKSGKQWENIYKAKVRAVTSTYRDTGEIPEVPPPPAEKETLPPNT